MAHYRGVRGASGTIVTVDNEPLDPRVDLHNMSMVFEWGYIGSGPYQLAIALLAHHRDDAMALNFYKDFAEFLIADIKDDQWDFDSKELETAIVNAAPVPMSLSELMDRVRRGG